MNLQTRWFSLRRRLLTLLLMGVVFFWLMTMVMSYIDAHHEIDELFDAQLMQTAQTLLGVARGNERVWHESETTELAASLHKYQRKLRFQIWRDDGRLLLRSPNAPLTAITDQSGFSSSSVDASTQGRDHEDVSGYEKEHESRYQLHRYRWRNLALWDEAHRVQVQVSENHDIRNELSGKIVSRLLLPALLGLPLLALWLWLATQKGLSSLNEVAQQISERHADHLEPVVPNQAPDEIRPMIDALNRLFARLHRTLENERRFTADAAHELRTPLAALLAHAQVAQRAQNTSEREHALDQLHRGIGRTHHLVDQLLTLARLDPDDSLVDIQHIDFSILLEEACAEQGAKALEKNITLELNITHPPASSIFIAGSAALLRILLRNLIDNAVRYTPRSGQVQISLHTEGHDIVLAVCDSGPGIPVGDRLQVFERFKRLAGQAQPGSGLGLSIIRRIADLHGATVTLEDAPSALGGLKVSVRFCRAS